MNDATDLSPDDLWDLVQKRGAPHILVALLDGVKESPDLVEVAPISQQTVSRRMRELEAADLVDGHILRGKNRHALGWQLTERGRALAESVAICDQTIQLLENGAKGEES